MVSGRRFGSGKRRGGLGGDGQRTQKRQQRPTPHLLPWPRGIVVVELASTAADWLDFNSIQSGHRWAVPTYERVIRDRGLSPAKPTVDMEPSYENHPTGARTPRIDSHQVRKGALGDACRRCRTRIWRPGHVLVLQGRRWTVSAQRISALALALAYEGSRQVGLVRRLFELRPWYKLVPDQSVIASGQGDGEDHVQAARAEDGSFALAYLPHGGKIGIHMDRLTGKQAKARWYDPRTGKWQEIGDCPSMGIREFAAPTKGDRDDWVLVLDDAAKGYPTSFKSAPETSPAGTPPAAGPVRVEIRKEAGKLPLSQRKTVLHSRGGLFRRSERQVSHAGHRRARKLGPLWGKPILDEAQRLGMTVTVGLPMRMEWADKFDYSDEQAVRRQFEQMKKRVLELKDHPAVLLWGVGNELSVRYKNKKVWDAVNDVARMIHEVDPNHPAMTVIGEADREVVQEIIKRCPDLDLLGVNNYQGVETVPAKLREAGWDKPYAITEWGPSGDWQVSRTKWGALIEETSTEGAAVSERYQNTMLKDTERCLGSYAFIWMLRHERTPTWYGMFLGVRGADRGGQRDAVPVDREVAVQPSGVEPPRIDGHAARYNVYLKPGSRHTATVQVEDPDGDRWTCRWRSWWKWPEPDTRAGASGGRNRCPS